MKHMVRAGIRELKQNASALIRRVVAGETIEVTERGRPVARIVPLRDRSVLDQMISEGRATRARGDLLEIKPIKASPGRRRLSDILAEMRADER
jgi:prevent-host-death family protein